MPLPIHEVGLVISFSYLWRYEYEKGNEEGRKNRPCVIILSVKNENELMPIVEEVIKLKFTPTERAMFNAYIVNANVDKKLN